MNLSNQPIRAALPAAALRPYINHYWLSLNNSDETCSVTPDGAVDVVVMISATTYQVDAFGTTTKRSEFPLEVGNHYLGIRFRPCQSRHFLDIKASDLTDAAHTVRDGFLPDISWAIESISTNELFTRLDAVLLQHLKQNPPVSVRIDDIVRYIEATQSPLRVSELANMYCKSLRQFERAFRDVAGLSPKLFLEIIRFQRATALLENSKLPIIQVAAALGYADQSHLTHEFRRFFGHPPTRLREHVAFLQDQGHLNEYIASSFYLQ